MFRRYIQKKKRAKNSKKKIQNTKGEKNFMHCKIDGRKTDLNEENKIKNFKKCLKVKQEKYNKFQKGKN